MTINYRKSGQWFVCGDTDTGMTAREPLAYFDRRLNESPFAVANYLLSFERQEQRVPKNAWDAENWKMLAPKPQDFDTSTLPLFGDGHKQKEMF